ncbi:hypothetical protein OIY81_2991 [Cryptosporidium canis]|nr:hypothetical protein OIY81_2991 [Cryptosporidium canis]
MKKMNTIRGSVLDLGEELVEEVSLGVEGVDDNNSIDQLGEESVHGGEDGEHHLLRPDKVNGGNNDGGNFLQGTLVHNQHIRAKSVHQIRRGGRVREPKRRKEDLLDQTVVDNIGGLDAANSLSNKEQGAEGSLEEHDKGVDPNEVGVILGVVVAYKRVGVPVKDGLKYTRGEQYEAPRTANQGKVPPVYLGGAPLARPDLSLQSQVRWHADRLVGAASRDERQLDLAAQGRGGFADSLCLCSCSAELKSGDLCGESPPAPRSTLGEGPGEEDVVVVKVDDVDAGGVDFGLAVDEVQERGNVDGEDGFGVRAAKESLVAEEPGEDFRPYTPRQGHSGLLSSAEGGAALVNDPQVAVFPGVEVVLQLANVGDQHVEVFVPGLSEQNGRPHRSLGDPGGLAGVGVAEVVVLGVQDGVDYGGLSAPGGAREDHAPPHGARGAAWQAEVGLNDPVAAGDERAAGLAGPSVVLWLSAKGPEAFDFAAGPGSSSSLRIRGSQAGKVDCPRDLTVRAGVVVLRKVLEKVVRVSGDEGPNPQEGDETLNEGDRNPSQR